MSNIAEVAPLDIVVSVNNTIPTPALFNDALESKVVDAAPSVISAVPCLFCKLSTFNVPIIPFHIL